MASSSAGNDTAVHSTSTRFQFSPVDSPARLSLTPDQFARCSEALSSFKQKLESNPQLITQEFAHLQANRIRPSQMAKSCTVALNSVNVSKNRYTDILPCGFFYLFF